MIRIGLLLAILVALVAEPVFHAVNSSKSGPSTPPPLTPAQKSAAQAALSRVHPPTTFSRYTTWRLAASSNSSVPCLARPAICFGSSDVVRPLTAHALANLLAEFHVRVRGASCTDSTGLPIGSCNGSATIPGYGLGFIVTSERPVNSDERPGTQVVLFAIKRT